MQSDSHLFTTLLVWSMVLAALVFARISWRRLRAGLYVCIGLSAILLDYLSNGLRFEYAFTRQTVLLVALAVGLQIAWDGYQAGRLQQAGARRHPKS